MTEPEISSSRLCQSLPHSPFLDVLDLGLDVVSVLSVNEVKSVQSD